jgi:hypothetical protein
MKTKYLWFFFVSILISVGCSTQKNITHPNVVKTGDKHIEFIGLEQWTPEELLNEIRKENEYDTFTQGPVQACSAVLENMGFAKAAVHESSDFKTISVVEEQNVDLIKYRNIPAQENPIIKQWNDGINLDDKDNLRGLNFVSQFFKSENGSVKLRGKLILRAYGSKEENKLARNIIDRLKKISEEEDHKLALQTLKEDGNITNRIWAMLIFLNTNAGDVEKNLVLQQVNVKLESYRYDSISINLLKALTSDKKMTDWSSSTSDIKSLLHGAGIWDYQKILDILSETQISSLLADEIVDQRYPLLDGYLNAYDEDKTEAAFKFVKQLSGENLKTTKDASSWLNKRYAAKRTEAN